MRDRSQDKFFIEWLEAHGETNVIADEQGVGLANNPTRLRASVYKTTPHGDGTVVVETEFRTRMPGGGELVDYVAGIGDSAKRAEDDAKLNFVLTTFHVLYRGFLNPSDPHQTEEKVEVNGAQRLLICGDLYSRGTGTNQEEGFHALLPALRKTVASLPLSAQPHAIKVVYSQKENAPLTVAAELDGQMYEPLAEKLRALPWPRQTNFYLVKQFMLLK